MEKTWLDFNFYYLNKNIKIRDSLVHGNKSKYVIIQIDKQITLLHLIFEQKLVIFKLSLENGRLIENLLEI